MTTIAPEIADIRIYQKLGRIDKKSLETVDQLLLLLPAKPKASDFSRIPQGAKLQALLRKHKPGSTPAFTSRLVNSKQTLVVAGTLSADTSTFEQLTLGRKLVAAATNQKAGCLGICALGFKADDQARIISNVLAAALAAASPLPAFKTKKVPPQNPDDSTIGSRCRSGYKSHRSRSERQQPRTLADHAATEYA